LRRGQVAWWHAGEERAVTIHGTDIAGPLAIRLFGAVLGVAYLFVLLPDQILIVALITVLAAALLSIIPITQGRKAIILTPTSVVYRNSWSKPQEIPFAEIVRMKRVNLPGYRATRPGLRLELASGDWACMYLTVKNPNEALHRLMECTRKAIEPG
jgi:hypothetical protein